MDLGIFEVLGCSFAAWVAIRVILFLFIGVWIGFMIFAVFAWLLIGFLWWVCSDIEAVCRS